MSKHDQFPYWLIVAGFAIALLTGVAGTITMYVWFAQQG